MRSYEVILSQMRSIEVIVTFWGNLLYKAEDPVFNTPGQSVRLEKKLFPNEIEPIKALCGKIFFSSRALLSQGPKNGVFRYIQ
jgi:hypothetical protein